MNKQQLPSFELKPSHKQVRSGIYVDVLHPQPSDITIGDIASGLSMQCRYNGHSSDFYSVAQHSVLVSYEVPPEQALAALLHDASEAYIGDIAAPLKQFLPDFKRFESLFDAVIEEVFQVSIHTPEIKAADQRLLATEARDFMPINSLADWNLEHVTPLEVQIIPLSHDAAMELFLNRYYELLTLSGAELSAVIDFNAIFPVGTAVKLKGAGDIKTRIQSPAWATPGGRILVELDGISGGVSIRQIEALAA